MQSRNNNIDIVKAISCIGIVLMHCDYPNNITIYIKVINRFGVPFFYFVSGYYFIKNNDIKLKKIILKIIHIFNLLFYSGIFYLIFFLIYKNNLYHYNWNIGNYTKKIFTKGKVMKFLISNDPFIYSHLWFLLALLYSYFLLFVLKILNNNIIVNNIFVVTAIFFGEIGYIILGEFSGLKIIKTTYLISNTDKSIYFPNLFIFRAFPFIMIGIYIRINNIKINLSLKKYFFIFIIGTFLSCIEYYFINKSLIIYISTFIQIFSLIGFSISNDQIKRKFLLLSYIGRELSPKIYIYHIAIKKLVYLILLRLKFKFLVYFQFLMVLLLTITISLILKIIQNYYLIYKKIKLK